jgi:hypothetical protein
LTTQLIIPTLIVNNRISMLPTIKLDTQLFLDTVKIEDVSPHRMLPPELRSGDTAIPQQLPQQRFRISHPASHLACVGANVIGQLSGVMRHSLIHARA